MNGAIIDSIYNTFFKLKISHVYERSSRRLDVNDVALGEVLCVADARDLVLRVVHCLHGDSGRLSLAVGGALSARRDPQQFRLRLRGSGRVYVDPQLAGLRRRGVGATADFLFSGTFFPISLYPHWLAIIVACSPLYQSAALLRGFSLGVFSWTMIVHVAYLAAMGCLGLAIANKRFRRILAP